MTLLITVFAAVITTVLWYTRKSDKLGLGFLCLMFWGASLMWFVDAVFEYIELKEEYFTPALEDMINDTFLGLSVVALALVVWVVRLLITDPRGVVKRSLQSRAAR